MRIGKDCLRCVYMVMERLGPVLMDVVLPIPSTRFVNVDEVGAGID